MSLAKKPAESTILLSTKGDFATRKDLHAAVVLSVGTNMFKGFLGSHSIHGEIKSTARSRWQFRFDMGWSICLVFPQLSADSDVAGRVRCACPERPQFEKYDIHMLEIRSGSMRSICPSGLQSRVPDRHQLARFAMWISSPVCDRH